MPEPEPEWSVLRRRAIGDRIRTVRRHRKLTQEQLAHAVGLERRTVHRHETGQRDTPLSLLIAIADALDVPLAVLVADTLELDLRNVHRDHRPTR
ncbi:helix-turn-helix domain-containing protein [Streptomyces cylindrosporus]|uniref:helix-turn-helix domain-containing protein n=1 Tax=Streptomyces cylindrosporus TaxID=2927583 RepID=UPI0027E2757F|nr:helix-turn-helix transcriptional regulator [Streptomyces cylindrosporus]